ncbi:adenylate/guanylate cyclase domain-containing protein [Capnocytophaga leadbetteri]|uniref:adenylate/guanylate cyclase domain-containing protein n=1 Tax=Capnocytophaga leadbetteri TaxID=327575 RepID=UPI0026F29053|nr:adenylate/guanylate cyclase domain-containing protein [Capnocytophaga leadbetteri]
MNIKDKLSEIELDIKDVKNLGFSYTSTKKVPSRQDTDLTFEKGKEKKGKEIETCVLFVDIRNSVQLNKRHSPDRMGKIYTAFTKSMLKIAQYHSGEVRNIIGDRVMIVFPTENCAENAVECAISINHISEIMNMVFSNVDFRCGIGIDYGKMRVIKVGIIRQGDNNVENKNLVWVGNPANIASRLTDIANKEIDFLRVKYEETVWKYCRNSPRKLVTKECESLLSCDSFFKPPFSDKYNFFGVKILSLKIEKQTMPPILITENVYDCLSLNIKGYFKEQKNIDIKDNFKKVYGENLKWE